MFQSVFPHSYSAIIELLRKRIAAPAPGLIQLLTGPRQVGKTTLLLQLAEELGDRCLYVAADSPEASLAGWGKWAIEIKTGHYRAADLAGLFEFCKIHNGFTPLVLCDKNQEHVARQAGIQADTWQHFLLQGIASKSAY